MPIIVGFRFSLADMSGLKSVKNAIDGLFYQPFPRKGFHVSQRPRNLGSYQDTGTGVTGESVL